MATTNRTVFFDGLRRKVRGRALSQKQVEHAGVLLDYMDLQPGLLRSQAAYILATAFHETDQFLTMEEYADGNAYEGRRDLGNIRQGDGRRYKGRGYVQLTGRRNYDIMAAIIGEPLVEEPHLAAVPINAAEITILGMVDGHFTGESLDKFVNETGSDFVKARAVVNGADRNILIADHAVEFEALLEKAGFPPVTRPDAWRESEGISEDIGLEDDQRAAGPLSFSSALGCGSSIGILCTAIAASDLLPEPLMQPMVITAASTLLTALATALGLCRHINPTAVTFLTRR